MISKLRKLAAVSFVALMVVANTGSVFASDVNSNKVDILSKYTVESSHGMMTECEVQPAWLGYGPITRYPAEGGTWQYGFWNAKVRSNYTVNRCHGSTVKLNKKTNRSINTAAGKTSYAEIWTAQHDGDDKYYYRLCK